MKCSCDFSTHNTLGAVGPATLSVLPVRCVLPRYVDHGSAAEEESATKNTKRHTATLWSAALFRRCAFLDTPKRKTKAAEKRRTPKDKAPPDCRGDSGCRSTEALMDSRFLFVFVSGPTGGHSTLG